MTPSRMIESDYGNCGKGKVTEHFQEKLQVEQEKHSENVIDEFSFQHHSRLNTESRLESE
jgi:hypothetical protein